MLIKTIQEIIRAELKKVRFLESGVVTSTFPHSEENDWDNYEVNVRLKNSDLELRHVPVSTRHMGSVAIPDVGDLVLISFINGNINQPVMIGRLYNDAQRPPLSVEKEYLIENPLGENTRIKIDKDKNILLESGATQLQLSLDGSIHLASEDKLDLSVKGDLSLRVDGSVDIQTRKDLTIKAEGNIGIECTDAAIKASGTIDLGESGGKIVTDMTHKCFITGAPPVGSQTVKAKS